MKKIVAIMTACVMALMCAGCGAAKTEATEETVALPNPMVEVTADELMDKLGLSFNVPDGAEDVKYFVINNEMAEMRFTYNTVNCCARIKPTVEFEDISGMYYKWNVEETGKVSYNEAQIKRYNGNDITVDACLWFDAAPGLMYSVTADGKDLDGFDIQAVAEQTYVQTQGDVG